MTLNERLERATEYIRSGKTEEARQLLEQIIKEDRHNIAAWQWYAETWPDPRDRIRVWEVCLRHNPSNAEAEQALALLKPNLSSRDHEATRPGKPSGKGLSRGLLWTSMGLLAVMASLAVIMVRNSAPLDPAEYRHSQPVEYYLYVPKDYSDDQEWPLFVGVHGAGGNGLDCWNTFQAHAEKEGFLLLCPSIPGDASGFYQDVGENTVWSAVGEVKKEYRLRPRMFMSGFSAGAFFIQGFMYHYPQYVSGLSVLSAGLYLEPRLFPQLVPVLVVIGSADHPDAVQSSRLFVDELKKYGFDVEYRVLPNVGHTVTQDGVRATIELFRKTVGK